MAAVNNVLQTPKRPVTGNSVAEHDLTRLQARFKRKYGLKISTKLPNYEAQEGPMINPRRLQRSSQRCLLFSPLARARPISQPPTPEGFVEIELDPQVYDLTNIQDMTEACLEQALCM